MNKSAETLKTDASFLACSLLMERFPVTISETRPRVPNTGRRSLAARNHGHPDSAYDDRNHALPPVPPCEMLSMDLKMESITE